MLVWFRWHYDKKLLRNIDDDEFMEFSSKCPERQAVMVSAQAELTTVHSVPLPRSKPASALAFLAASTVYVLLLAFQQLIAC
jgi:hypothetical protein